MEDVRIEEYIDPLADSGSKVKWYVIATFDNLEEADKLSKMLTNYKNRLANANLQDSE